jgi:adenylate kinase family enzyme
VAYERQTMPLADYYRRQGLLDAVDASAGMEDVSRALEKIIQRVEGRNGRL